MPHLRNTAGLAVLVVAALTIAGCSSGSNDMSGTAGKGQIQLQMTTAGATTAADTTSGTTGTDPSTSLKSADVTFSKIQARDTTGTMVDVLVALPYTVDLLSLQSGRTITLPVGFLPPGTYDQLVLTITAINIVANDGTTIVITPPAGGWVVPVNATPFTVVEGQATTVKLTFRRDLSFHLLGGLLEFEPHFECHH